MIILNNDLSIKSRKFTATKHGVVHNFEIVGTRSVGYKVEETIDTIKNLATGRKSEVYRKDLLKYQTDN